MTFYSHDKFQTRLGDSKGDNSRFEKIHRRSVKTFLDVLVLSKLRKRAVSGYDVIAFIHNKFRLPRQPGHRIFSPAFFEKRRLDKRQMAAAKATIKAIPNANDKIQ